MMDPAALQTVINDLLNNPDVKLNLKSIQLAFYPLKKSQQYDFLTESTQLIVTDSIAAKVLPRLTIEERIKLCSESLQFSNSQQIEQLQAHFRKQMQLCERLREIGCSESREDLLNVQHTFCSPYKMTEIIVSWNLHDLRLEELL